MLKAFVFLNYTLVFVPFWLFFIKKKNVPKASKMEIMGRLNPLLTLRKHEIDVQGV